MTQEQPALYEMVDYHIHTCHSGCAETSMSPEKIVHLMEEKGFSSIGFADHQGTGVDPECFKILKEECSRIKTGLKVFVGCEAQVESPDKVSIDRELADTMDFVLLSASHFNANSVEQPAGLKPEVVAEHYLRMFTKAVETEFVDVIAHPFCTNGDVLGDMSLIMRLIPKNELVKTLETAKRNNIAIELREVSDPDHNKCLVNFYHLCRDVGLKFSIGSDAHHLDEVGKRLVSVPMARKMEIKDEELWHPAEKKRIGHR